MASIGNGGVAMTTSSTNQRSRARLMTNFSIDSIIGNLHLTPVASKQRAASDRSNHPKSDHCQPQPHLQPQPRVPQVAAKKKTRPKNFQCPACPMAFSNNGQLRNHVRIHTGERPFKCNFHECGKTFTRNEELTRHKLIHSGVRPHTCASCGKQFGRKDHLKKHVRTHEKQLRKTRRAVRMQAGGIHSLIMPSATHCFDYKLADIVDSKQGCLARDNFDIKKHQRSLTKSALGGCLPPGYQNQPQFSNLQPSPTLVYPSTSFPFQPQVTSSCFESGQLVIQQAQVTKTSLLESRDITATVPATAALSQFATAASAMGTIQRLASDYWQNWYNFLGYQQQQQQNLALCLPPEKKLERIIRKI